MKVLLTNPLKDSAEMEYSDLGLGYLAASLRQHGHDVVLIFQTLSQERFGRLLEIERPEVVGVKVFSSNVQEAIQTITFIRAIASCVVTIGGPHVSGDAANVLNYIPADYAFSGEAEISFPEFVGRLEAGTLQGNQKEICGLIYRANDQNIINGHSIIEDLDALPFSAWDLMKPKKYSSLVCKRRSAVGLLASRGCSNHCDFCAESNKRLRFRDPKNIGFEIKFLVDRFGVKEVQLLDSNFLAHKNFVMELCENIIESDLNLVFCAPNGARLEAVDDEVCSLLAQAGFYRFNVGIESGSQRVLDQVHKRLELELVDEKIACFRRKGIHVVGNFMLGFPDETREDMEKTLKLALSLDISAANFSIFVPMPGTVLYDDLVRRGRLPAKEDFSVYDFISYDNSFSELSPAELKKFRNHCLVRFIFDTE